MANCDIAKQALKVVIAQICQNIGWHAIQSSPMDILVDVLQRYIFEIAKSVHQYSTQYNRTEPNLDDLGLTFKDFNIVLQEIEEYINNVESVPPVYKVAAFPVKHSSNLQHPKPDSRELLVRPDHIPSYLPLMHPDEEDLLFSQQSAIDGVKKNSLEAGASRDSSPLSSPKHGLKRNDWPSETSKNKSRYYSEEEGRPMREVTSVFLTPAGFVSPVHVGKRPDSSLPCLVDSPPPSPEVPPLPSASSKKDSKLKDLKKDKSSKSKKDKKIIEKDLKKLKSSKKEKENKENAASKHEKSLTSSSSSKKDHGSSHKSSKSEKSMKSDESVRQKSKSDKMKLKAQKEDLRKMKDTFKLSSKLKAKFKHTAGTGSSSHVKSSKLSSKKFKTSKLPKIKHLKVERTKIVDLPPMSPSPPPEPSPPKEIVFEHKLPLMEPKDVSKEMLDDFMEEDELDFREESPERLVIDDSLETQARQERESRLEVIDECINAVIRRGEEESAVDNRAMDDTINSVVRGPNMMNIKKLEPKDIYDFTDTSDGSSLSSCDDAPPHSPVHAPKKEKKTKSSDSPKRSKKDKQKKKKESRSRSPNPYASPKSQKSSFMLRVEDRTPSPILKDDLLSSDGSTPSSSPRSSTFFDHSPQAPAPAPPILSHVPPILPPPFVVPGTSYTSSPFAAMRNLPCHTNPHFPTPPLFVNNSKSESGSTFQNIQPLNLAKSGPSSLKSSPEKLETSLPVKTENSDLIKKAANIIDKSKGKDHKKEKPKKKGKKETEKAKEKKEEIKEKEKPKPKEKPKIKSEKNVKVEKRKSKPEKRKAKDEKAKEDSTVPKMTLKLSSGSGSTKIFVKPNTKTSTSLSSSPSPPHDTEEEEPVRSPSPPLRAPTPSPPRVPTPPPAPRIPTPPPPRSPTPPPVAKKEVVKEESPPPAVISPPPITTKGAHSRGRGRGKKAAAQPVIPPARTVITETLGTIVDESGNKIWICPACSRADDGSPMIGCDECDDWYHWVCVGIVVPPKEEENWFCVRCIAKRQAPKDKRKRKKHRKEK